MAKSRKYQRSSKKGKKIITKRRRKTIKSRRRKQRGGSQELIDAVKNDNVEVKGVKELLANSATDVNMEDSDKRSALYLAVVRGRTDVVKVLLEHGANPNLADKYGRTALHAAAREGDVNMVSELLKHGANPKKKDEDNKTAYDIANYYDDEDEPNATIVTFNNFEKEENQQQEDVKNLQAVNQEFIKQSEKSYKREKNLDPKTKVLGNKDLTLFLMSKYLAKDKNRFEEK
ncbi:ankyrin repeat domain-containing protein [bacterium]|nr:ankyrin repeat domain-containing protein [bacterium]